MIKIRLARHGAKKRPFYRIVVANAEAPRDGSFIEKVGTYDPVANPAKISLNTERIQYWLGQGAEPTDTVANILKKENVTKA